MTSEKRIAARKPKGMSDDAFEASLYRAKQFLKNWGFLTESENNRIVTRIEKWSLHK